MSVNIISRAQWGAKPWTSTPASVPRNERTEFFIHYDGAAHILRTGASIPRAIEAEHLGQGWSGVGYNFVVSQAGDVYEGRGWDLQAAQCTGHNRSGIGVQIAIGGDQEPSPAALAAARALYDEACARFGRPLAKMGHKDGLATDCPGTALYAWVRAGMPVNGSVPAPSTPTAPPVQTDGLLRRGSTGQAVRDMQALFNSKGLGPLVVDGDFGQATEAAVRAAQAAVHVAVDGIFGPQTRAAVEAYSRPSVPSAVLRRGSKGADVRQVQTALNACGFGPLVVDGDYGPATEAAVRRAQGTFGVSVDGVWGPKTAAAYRV